MDLSELHETPPWDWPEDAGELFLEALRNRKSKESDRLTAAELGGDIVVLNDDLADALMAVVASPEESPDMRAKAAISLGPGLELWETQGVDDPDEVEISESTFNRMVETLHTAFEDRSIPKETRRRILEGAVRSAQPWQIDAIREAYASGDREWVLTAVFAMRYVRGFDKEIVESLDNPDEEIRQEAVGAASNWEVAEAWTRVVKLATDRKTPKDLRIEAIGAVGSIRPAEAREVLGKLTDSHDEDIAEAAFETIAEADARLGVEDGADEDEDEEFEEEEDDESEPGGWVN